MRVDIGKSRDTVMGGAYIIAQRHTSFTPHRFLPRLRLDHVQIVLHMEPSYPSHDRPIEEAKRKLNEYGGHHPLFDDEKLVSTYLKHFDTKDDDLFWAWQRVQDYISTEPRRAWEITLQLIAAANESALGYVAAGPLEDLLYSRAEQFVDEVERLARTDPKFLSALRMVNGPFTQIYGLPLRCKSVF